MENPIQKLVSRAVVGTHGEVNSIDARSLYAQLEVTTKFADWINRRLEIFVANEDYVVILKNEKNPSGGRPAKEYILTLDAAKHIAMMEKNDKGKEIRQAFIDFEKQQNELAKQKAFAQLPNFRDPVESARAWADEVEKKEIALRQVEQKEEVIKKKDELIVAAADLNIKAGDVSIGDFAKNLAFEGLGRNNLFAWLKGRGFLMGNTSPYQQYVERGYFVRKPTEEKHGGKTRYQTFLTPKGSVWLSRMLHAEFGED